MNNDSFKLFCKVLTGIIACFEKDRAHIAHALKTYIDKVNETEHIKQQGLEIAERLLEKAMTHVNVENEIAFAKEETGKQSVEETKILARAVKYYQEEREGFVSEISLLRSLATSGLITASIVHDLKSLRANLGVRVDNLRASFERGEQVVINSRLDAMKNDDESIKGWISVVATQSKADKRKRKKHELCSLITETVNSIQPILEKRKSI